MSEEKITEFKLPECGYPLSQIYFYMTEGCNLKCRHCWIEPKFQASGNNKWPSIEFDLFKDICYQGRELGMNSVKLTGGEPLINPDIDKILDFIYEEKFRLTIETNGIELTPEICEKIARCEGTFISISLDGSTAEEHEWVRGVPGCFEAALQGARNLVAVGIRPQFIMSIMKRNAHQIEDIIELARKENAESVKYNLVTPTARGEQMHEAGETLSIEELIRIGKWVEDELQPKYKDVRLHYSHPVAFKPFGKMFERPLGRCGIFGIIGVLGNGKYALCGIGETVPELVFGDARKDKLADVWNNNQVLNDIRKGLPKDLNGICGDCLVKNKCLGSCVAMNYYRHHDLFAPFWYCEEALKAGLFPKTRIKPGSPFEKV